MGGEVVGGYNNAMTSAELVATYYRACARELTINDAE